MNSPVRYRRPAADVEAMRYDGSEESQRAIVNWTNGLAEGFFDHEYHLVIHTPFGDADCRAGDWVIRDTNGSCWPCKADAFGQEYEAVGDAVG